MTSMETPKAVEREKNAEALVLPAAGATLLGSLKLPAPVATSQESTPHTTA